MTPQQLFNAPHAIPQPQRLEQALLIDDYWHRLVFATTLESRMLWARRLNGLKRAALPVSGN